MFIFDIWSETSLPSGACYGAALRSRPSSTPIVFSNFATEEQCRDWLESEARRISREMLEMSAPLVATSPELLEPAEVRFG